MQRIEYIDAMRGLTMLLVVYSHVCACCLGDRLAGGNDVLFLFRLPCFFFISGWLFTKPGRQWTAELMVSTARKKAVVQLVPTAIFFVLLTVVWDWQPPQVVLTKLGAQKAGYWFTFALFEFFILTMVMERALQRHRHGEAIRLAVAIGLSAVAFGYDIGYTRLVAIMPRSLTLVLGFLGLMTWRYYLFFLLGTMARRHEETFLRVVANGKVMTLVALVFIVAAAARRVESVPWLYLVFVAGGVSGMTLVYALMRAHARLFSHATAVGRTLIYIGTRTLNIYLLHYFFLPRFLLPLGFRLRSLGSIGLEAVIALVIAVVVVAMCLAFSRMLERWPGLYCLLFGTRPR